MNAEINEDRPPFCAPVSLFEKGHTAYLEPDESADDDSTS